MSGGLDSWVLYNLLPQRERDIRIFNIRRKDGFDSAERVRLLTERDDIIEVDEMSDDPAYRIGRTVDHIIKTWHVEELYLGLNRAPPTEYFPEFETPQRPFRPWINTWPAIRMPFLPLYKYHIFSLAVGHGIDVNNTLSCIANKSTPCGMCWQCLERKWGWNELNQSGY
jgi:hypothetical protein